MVAFIAQAAPALGWGPHTEITRAAIDVLPADSGLNLVLDDLLLQRFSWLPDYKDKVLPDYSANDFLVFEGFEKLVTHMPPEVQTTYRPFFHRALLAMRTESRVNAARWVGALLHFVQDSGSPPHAFPTAGPLHFPMENFVKGDRIEIPGYIPKLLGDSDASAAEGLVKRMEELMHFSKGIGEKLKPICERNDKAAAEPLVLEAALECARVSADVLHTLLKRAEAKKVPDTRLEILVRAPKTAGRPLAPARLRVIEGGQATFSDAITESSADYYRGRILLRGVAAGKYDLEITRMGAKAFLVKEVGVVAGRPVRLSVELEGE
jgi:hypothetical protein